MQNIQKIVYQGLVNAIHRLWITPKGERRKTFHDVSHKIPFATLVWEQISDLSQKRSLEPFSFFDHSPINKKEKIRKKNEN